MISILHNGIESGNNKPFWNYVKYQKQETFGYPLLKVTATSFRYLLDLLDLVRLHLIGSHGIRVVTSI